ncbi:protein TonB [Muriicola jejuensis]|uniref:TonB family protein n=1 Tax=Muriicola jejuensis TaxID=504488 RepID=A0A6P0UC91_9FLAO|nr:energy transducer TonB [Muriicola jejuensis]NER09499.1 TonB family protein [Muriicola jejuensis]SMP08083.1 protein TonB [Muriicola jejuensis]
MKKAAPNNPVSGPRPEAKNEKRSSWIRKREVNRRGKGTLYFQLGLILAMVFAYFGLEASFRTEVYQDSIISCPIGEVLLVEQEQVLLGETPIARENKAVKNPAEIIIDDSDPMDMEAVIEVESPQFPPLPLDSIAYSDPSKEEPPVILIDLVDEVPIFPGCEKVDKEERLACFNEKMQDHIKRNFSYPQAAIDLGVKGRVNLSFTIDEKGRVSALKFRGPSPLLEKEAERIILKLPVMVPGKQNGIPVRVPYSLPINFLLN